MEHQKEYYINRFKTKCAVIPRSRDKLWYGKYNWKIGFYLNPSSPTNHSLFDENWAGRYTKWNNVRRILSTAFPKELWRGRFENHNGRIFTNDPKILDFILGLESLSKDVCELEYTNTNYLDALKEIDPKIVTNVRFLKKWNPLNEFVYEVELGGFHWKDTESRYRIADFILENNDIYRQRRELRNRIETQNTIYKERVVWHGYKFYVKDVDDLMPIHLISPGKIKKVVLLKKKG